MNPPDVTSKDRFLSSRQRYQPIALPEDFSNEEMARNTIKIAETVGRLRAQHKARTSPMKRYRTSLCCRSGMSYRMARTLSRIAKLGEKAVARSNCPQNRNILFKCPR